MLWLESYYSGIDITYKEGKQNLSDPLSRRSDHNIIVDATTGSVQLSSIAAAVPDPDFITRVKAAYEHDTWLSSSKIPNSKVLCARGRPVVLPAAISNPSWSTGRQVPAITNPAGVP